MKIALGWCLALDWAVCVMCGVRVLGRGGTAQGGQPVSVRPGGLVTINKTVWQAPQHRILYVQ